MMAEIDQLHPAPAVLDDRRATEVLRVWAGADRQLLTLKAGWADPLLGNLSPQPSLGT
jgi:hypothetical protein